MTRGHGLTTSWLDLLVLLGTFAVALAIAVRFSAGTRKGRAESQRSAKDPKTVPPWHRVARGTTLRDDGGSRRGVRPMQTGNGSRNRPPRTVTMPNDRESARRAWNASQEDR